MERLQGAARLLYEMVEPMLKAATKISILLAQSFFMGFCVMFLALLALLRVLVQQMLLDVVSVYNEVSSQAKKVQSMKITQDGIEVFREYYPTTDEEIIVLEWVWKTDKFVLLETKGIVSRQDVSSELIQTQRTSTKYQSIASFIRDDELDSENNVNEGEGGLPNAKRKTSESPIPFSNENNHDEQVQMPSVPQDGLENMLETSKSTLVEGTSSNSLNSMTSISYKPTLTNN